MGDLLKVVDISGEYLRSARYQEAAAYRVPKIRAGRQVLQANDEQDP